MEGKPAKPTTIDEYIAQQPDSLQPILSRIRAVIKESAPGAKEKISYNMPGYTLDGDLVWFCAWKQHISIYPKSLGMVESIPELSAYKGTKGSVHFPLDQPIPYELIEKIVKYRVGENQKK